GYAIIAPTNGKVHPTGKPYVLLSGGVETIATISPEEREELFRLARSFDEMPRPAERPRQQRAPSAHAGDRPGDLYSDRASWAEILEPHGWTLSHVQGDEEFWCRPGKDRREGHSATTNFQGSGLLYVFSSSTPFETEKGINKFTAY